MGQSALANKNAKLLVGGGTEISFPNRNPSEAVLGADSINGCGLARSDAESPTGKAKANSEKNALAAAQLR